MASSSAWTEEERAAVLAVRAKLVEKGLPASALGERELITITLNAKARVDEAVDKFLTFQNELVKAYGIDDVWAPMSPELDDQWHRLCVAGVDDGGRQLMWINGGGTPVAEEGRCMRSCILYFLAVHADMHTLRSGISLIIDTSNAPSRSARVGNEKKLQVAWQNFPTRPQSIFILGTNLITRAFINGLIAFASLFAKNKVIARIRFAKVDEIAGRFGRSALPQIHGGSPTPPTPEWVQKRLDAFPLMGLPPLGQEAPPEKI